MKSIDELLTEMVNEPKLITGIVSPLWQNDTDEVEFLKRTDTVYSKVPISALKERGIENRLFENLCENLPEGCYIAGGFMISLLQEDKNAKDIDIFCNSEESFKAVCNLLIQNKEESITEDDNKWSIKGYYTKNSIQEFNINNQDIRFLKFENIKSSRPEIQVMKMAFYPTPEHVIDTFDLTIAQICSDGESIYMNPLTVLDLSKKKLVLHRMQFPASTIRRIIKYAGKGYYACPGSLVNISKNIQEWKGMSDIDEENFVYLD